MKQRLFMTKNILFLVFVTAPNTLSPYDIDGMDNMARAAAVRSGKAISREFRGWYALKSASPEVVFGLEASIVFLKTVLAEQGPFDGIFGFSQGGLMAAVMCALLEHRYIGLGDDCMHPPLRFAVISSGYKLKDSRWDYVYKRPICTPSLHTYGVLDCMIGISRSMELRDNFVQPVDHCFVGA
ncbi:Family of serine hydrolases 3 [Coemansia sp. RSA 2531]|nr:Family of serine hydrolases 3 [Coemansia sp. RSA 2531]